MEQRQYDFEGKSSQLWAKEKISLKDRILHRVLLGITKLTSDAVLRVLNEVHIENQETFLALYRKRARGGKGLITTSNHLHFLDSILLSPMMKSGYFGDNFEDTPWSPAESTKFFENRHRCGRPFYRWWSGRMKLVPLTRGQGVKQASFGRMGELLNQGDWLNIYGEGGRMHDDKVVRPFRPGIGRLVVEAPETIILPYGHDGIQHVSPAGCSPEVRYSINDVGIQDILRFGQRIQIVIGEQFTLTELAQRVPKDRDGYLEVAAEIRNRVVECHQRARSLNGR